MELQITALERYKDDLAKAVDVHQFEVFETLLRGTSAL